MSELVCLAFSGRDTADRVLNDLRAMQVAHLVDLEDACVVIRDTDGGVHLKQAFNLVIPEAVSAGSWGGFFGLLVGMLFAHPLLGFLSGVAIGASYGIVVAKLTDYGIDDNYIRSLGSSIGPGSSALFVLTRKVTPDKVLAELSRYEGTVLRTSLSTEAEEKLRQALAPKPLPVYQIR